MKYSIEPYKGMTDRLFWLFILIAAAAAAVFLFVLFSKLHKKVLQLKKERMEELKKKLASEKKPVNIPALKDITLKKLRRLQFDLEHGGLTPRDTCIGISSVVRDFLTEAAGRNVDCQALYEIKQWNRPEVAEFIEELYGSEFAGVSGGDIRKYFNDAWRLVTVWR